jgi:hypothetical protein
MKPEKILLKWPHRNHSKRPFKLPLVG